MSKPEVSEHFAIDVILIHVLECDGVSDIADSPYRNVFENASVIVTNCFSPKWANLGLHRVHNLRREGCTVLTWVPPNFAALWPVVDSFGEHGVLAMLKSGARCNDIIEAFKNGSFNPMFGVRMNEQIARLKSLETSCDIKVSDFVERNVKNTKLWFTENHPSYGIVAWIGAQLSKAIGNETDTVESCSSYCHDLLGDWNVWPETHYEFDHFGFSYPIRYATTPHWGGEEWYHSLIRKICNRVESEV